MNRILFVLLCLTITACGSSEAQLAEAIAETESAKPTSTNILPTQTPKPTFTSTAVPTATSENTPTPTVEPPALVAEILTNVQVIEIEKFKNLNNWTTWESRSLQIENGVIKVTGYPNWSGALVRKKSFRPGSGVILKIKYTDADDFQFSFDTGEWNTDSYRNFGILGGPSPKAHLSQGKNFLGGNYLTGNITFKADKWFYVMIAIGKDGELIARMWDPDDLSSSVLYHERIGENWAGKRWTFKIQADTGTTVYLESFWIITFDSIER